MKPCWSCESYGPCTTECECAKCQDPEGYEDWKENNPEAYEAWLDSQRDNDDEYYG